MERTKYILIVILLFSGIAGLYASQKQSIYQAYISGNMKLWKKTMDDMELQKAKSNDFLLELINYQYGYIGWCLGEKEWDLADNYIAKGEKNIEILEKSGYKASMTQAYRSAFYGFRIGLNKFQAPFIGPKSVDCAKQAMKLDATNPYGYIQYGNSQYYMPAVFGGSKALALEHYKKAEKLMEQQKEQAKNDWNYLSLLTMIAKAYTEMDQKTAAKAYYEKILKLEPGYIWVKNELYPKLLKEMR
ncbi:MAG: hypothetical protein HC905_27415 [Bacteroidales bacterium]|nr:hypothetical protein [Bacteroidales bacterium]